MSKSNKKITSYDSADSGVFGDVLSVPSKTNELKIGFLAMGYFEYWRMYPALEAVVRDDLAQAHKRLEESLGKNSVLYPGMVDTLDRAEEAGKAFAAAGVELLIVFEGTYIPDFITLHAINCCGINTQILLVNTQTGCDVNQRDDYMATMRNSALIGISQLTGSFRKMKKNYDILCGEISDPKLYGKIKSIVNAHKAVIKLRNYTCGLVGHVFRGMYDLEFDTAKVRGFLGPEVMTIGAEHLVQLWQEVRDEDVQKTAASLVKRFHNRRAADEDVKKSVRLGIAMKKLTEKFNLDGLCFLGQHHIEKMTGAPARMGASLMIEHNNIMTACEGDIAGLVMMEIMYACTGNKPFQAEWGQFDVRNNAVFLLGHGIGSPDLAASDNAVTLTGSPEEWGFSGGGLNYELILKPGPVTMGHFISTGESWKMIISEGESIEFPCLPCNELHAMIKVKDPVEEYIRRALESGVAHHLITVHGSASDELKKAAALMRIETVIL